MKFHLKISLLVVFLLVLFCFSISFGFIQIPFKEILKIIFLQEKQNEVYYTIVFFVRLPQTLTAILVGSGLALSGLLMQSLFQNPLASPSVLGISSGASLGVASVILFSGANFSAWAMHQNLGNWTIAIAAILGSSIVMILILLLSIRIRNNALLLIIGLMIGNFTSALVGIWQYFSRAESIKDYLLWTFGSLGGLPYEQISILAFFVIFGTLLGIFLAKKLNILLLGEQYAQSMGLSIPKIRFGLIFISSILAGSITAFCGLIGFVGMTVPHLCRLWLQTSDHRKLSIACVLLGAVFVLFCDLLSKLPQENTVLPINSVTALVGSPFVIWIILSNKQLRF